MRLRLKWMGLLLLFPFLGPTPCAASEPNPVDRVHLITDFTYRAGKGDTREISRALALFGAKRKAVYLSAKYLMHKGLLEHYGKKQNEIFCLATNTIEGAVIEERFSVNSATYYVKVQTEVKSTDFIQAEIRDLELEKAERRFSYEEEMEQFVLKHTDPGEELSRAYRYIRKGQWRIAIIYLNHLGKKYPHWSDVYLAKAIGYYGMHDHMRMMEALKTACALGNQEACDDLASLHKNGDKPLNPN